MNFERRDVILIGASLLFIIGLTPFMPLIYSIGIGVGLFFGIKGFATMRKKSISQKVGEGFCAECGQQIVGKKCPDCDSS